MSTETIGTHVIQWFSEIRLTDVRAVGGKNAALGEMIHGLSESGIRVPNGFAVTADAYTQFLQETGLSVQIAEILSSMNESSVDSIHHCAMQIRHLILSTPLSDVLTQSIVILRLSDFKSNEYANLVGGAAFEPHEENPMIGFRGASRYYAPEFREAFGLECQAIQKVRRAMGLYNLKLMIPFCRTIEEGKKVQAEMARYGLTRGQDGLEIYVMCEIPSNVIMADKFCEIFDGFSIGSNDLTQLTLGVDRDSEIVSHVFNERDVAVRRLIASVITTAKANHVKIGICGQAPSDFPDFCEFLVRQGIDSISLSPDSVIKTTLDVLKLEEKLDVEATMLED